jgi:hypothetical protein
LSAGGAAWRLALTPLDALKTALQVAGPAAGALLADKVAARGVPALYDGALANAAASWVGRHVARTVLSCVVSRPR